MTWALYYHPESDSLFWSEEWPNDGTCEDVTGNLKYHLRAEERGIETPAGWNTHEECVDEPALCNWCHGGPCKENRKPFTLDAEVTSNGSGGIAAAIVKSYKKWERKPADLYPTPVEATEALIPALKAMKRPDGKPIKRIWEPSCGDGRIARVLEFHGFEVIATDIREYPGWGYGGLDFLCETPEEKWGWDIGEIDAIVGNPPFSLAEEFIRRARAFCPNVVMLLKQTYWNTKGRSEGLWKDETPTLELKLTWRLAFLKTERGNSPLMDCMWVIWTDEPAIYDNSGRGGCVTEPLGKKEYPGHGSIGFMPALQVLEGELADLTKLLRDAAPSA